MNRQQWVCAFAASLLHYPQYVMSVAADERSVEVVLTGRRLVRLTIRKDQVRVVAYQLNDQGRLILTGKVTKELADPGLFPALAEVMGFQFDG